MNACILAFCCLAVAFTSGGVVPHIPSGSVGISADGALVAGPAGSVQTNNGLFGLGAGVQVFGPSGEVNTQARQVVVSGLGHLDNTWGLGAEEGNWIHADNSEWHGEDDGQWLAEEHQDAEEETQWDNEEERQWGDNEDDDWNRRAKRQAPARKVSNGPEGRWNKELERYELFSTESSINSGWNNERSNWDNDGGAISPIGISSWTQFK